MRYILGAVRYAIAVLVGCALLGAPPAMGQHDDQEEAAQEAADSWLELFDAGDAEASWEEAAVLFQAEITEEQWVEQVEEIQASLGAVMDRQPLEAGFTEEIPDAPEGEYVVVRYQTEYEQSMTTETMVMALDEDEWRMAGYYIDPQETP